MKLMIFSGTTEGRRLSRLVAECGAEVTVCVATDYGREEQGSCPGVTVLTGRKTRPEMAELLAGFDLCVDATHPYAVEATQNIAAACGDASVRYCRLLREESHPDCGVLVADAGKAAELLAEKPGNILLTTGAKELPAFSRLDPARLYPRILPNHESLSACEALHIPHRNILAMQGPFSEEMNCAMLRQYRISYLVTKDGGSTGGFREKQTAAEKTGCQLVIIRRPHEEGRSFEEILTLCKEGLK